MNDPLLTQLGILTAVAIGNPVFAPEGDHACTVTVLGAGSVSATVLWQGSNDGTGWVTLGTLSPAGTAVGTAKAATTETYRYWRLNVTALTGSSVSGVVSSEASSGASPAPVSGAAGTIAASRNALASDSGGTWGLGSGIVYTLADASLIPAGVILQGTTSGGGTIRAGGSVTLNGAATDIVLSARSVAVVLPTPGSATDLTVKVS